MAYVIGILLAIVIATFAWLSKFDKDKSFYPTVLSVIASYYILFAVISGRASIIFIETVIALIFVGISIVGFQRSVQVVGIGLLIHGGFDLIHHVVIFNQGVPFWWAEFCLAFDIVLGVWLILLTRIRYNSTLKNINT